MDEQKRQYLNVKVATEKFKQNLEYLSYQQRKEVDDTVDKLFVMQQKILSSPEAKRLNVTAKEISKAYQTCIDNFDDKQSFCSALNNQGLSEEGYKMALAEELLCEKVMDSISSDIPTLDVDIARNYYLKNRLNFSRLTTWRVKQVLITINDDFEENKRSNALKRIHSVYLLSQTEDFGDLALKHSECPSAVENGNLGWCEEGKLFPEITQSLQTLKQGEISAPIETEVGFHLVQWLEKKAPYVAPFEEVLPFLEEKHTSRAKAFVQKQWLSQLVC
jgi:nitrogen fixation protein NifM